MLRRRVATRPRMGAIFRPARSDMRQSKSRRRLRAGPAATEGGPGGNAGVVAVVPRRAGTRAAKVKANEQKPGANSDGSASLLAPDRTAAPSDWPVCSRVLGGGFFILISSLALP